MKFFTKEEELPIVLEIRKHILDSFSNVVFNEEGHRYTVDGKFLRSVSSVTHKYMDKFDAKKQSISYAEKHGMTPEYWMEEWAKKGLMSTTNGTLVHEYGESLAWVKSGYPEKIIDRIQKQYDKKRNWLIPCSPMQKAVFNFFDDLDENLHVVLTECPMVSNKTPETTLSEQLCGTFDLLMYYDDPKKVNSGLYMFDYKTNNELESEYSRSHSKMCKAPFDFMYDESLAGYTFQQSLYSMFLAGIGLEVKGLRLVHIKPDETYNIVKLRDLSRTFPSFNTYF